MRSILVLAEYATKIDGLGICLNNIMKEPKFIQLTIQEKIGNDDYRGFLICEDTTGQRWELRGYGRNPVEVVADIMEKFTDNVEHWDGYGYTVSSNYGL